MATKKLNNERSKSRVSGAQAQSKSHDDPNEVDSRGRSMIYKSASKGQTEFVEYLHTQGGDINMTNITGTTPLHVV